MNRYACVLDNGEIGYVASFDNDADIPLGHAGYTFVPVDIDMPDDFIIQSYYDFAAKIFHKKPPRPDGFFEWSLEEKKWVLNLEAATTSARNERRSRLASSDWTQLPDVPLTTRNAWAEYRQALRDITNQPGYPLEIIWPTPPGQS